MKFFVKHSGKNIGSSVNGWIVGEKLLSDISENFIKLNQKNK